jgi:hypothetical protein
LAAWACLVTGCSAGIGPGADAPDTDCAGTRLALREHDGAEQNASTRALDIVKAGTTSIRAPGITRPLTNYALVLRNHSQQVLNDLALSLVFCDSNDRIVGGVTEPIDYVLPGQTIAFAGSTVGESVKVKAEVLLPQLRPGDENIVFARDDGVAIATVKVRDATRGRKLLSAAPGQLTVSRTRSSRLRTGELLTTAVVTSTVRPRLATVRTTAVYFDASNEVVGGESAYSGEISPHEPTWVRIVGVVPHEPPARTELYTALVHESFG